MKNLSYKILRTFNLLMAIIPTIAIYRATVQDSYKWGLLPLEGIGRSGDYWIALAYMIFAWISFLLERWYKRKWYYFFPISLFSLIFFVLLYGYLKEVSMVFQGDVWRFKFNIGLAIVLLSFILFLNVCVWSFFDTKKIVYVNFQYQKKDLKFVVIIFMLAALILTLFSQGTGSKHTVMDGIAVALTVFQSLFIAYYNDHSFRYNKTI